MARDDVPRRFDDAMLRRVRLDLGLTQDDAATALGIDVRTYRRYESGAVNDALRGFEVRSPGRRRLLQRMCRQFGIEREESWLRPDAPAPTVASRWVHPLQPARYFVGREALLMRLGAWCADAASLPRVMAVVAVGGAGKTALVERWTTTQPTTSRVFGWSFYDDPRVEAMLGEALAFVRGDGGGEGGRLERLMASLRDDAQPVLFVLDGLEVLQVDARRADAQRALGELESPELRRLVRAVAAGLGRVRVLVTSRLALTDLAAWEGTSVETVSLPDLAHDDARDLLRAWGVRGGDDALNELAAGVGGHALSVAMLGSYGGALLGGSDAHALDSLARTTTLSDEPLARRLTAVLHAYADALAPHERDALTRLCALGSGVELATLRGIADAGGSLAGSLAGLDAASLRLVLARLVRLGLVYRVGNDRFAAHPFVHAHFAARVGDARCGLHAVARDALAATLRDRPAMRIEDPATLDRLEELLVHTLESGRATDALRVYEHAMGGFAQLGLRAGAMSRGARVLRRFLVHEDPIRFVDTLDRQDAARIAYDFGLYRAAQGSLAAARACYETHLATLGRPRLDHAAGLRALAYALWLEGSLGAAAERLAHSVTLARAAGSVFHLARGLRQQAVVEHARGESTRASGLLAEARAIDPHPGARRALWEAAMRGDAGDRDGAMELIGSSQRETMSLEWPGHVAHARALRGLLLVDEDPARARAELLHARTWVHTSGEVEMALRCHELAARIALREEAHALACDEASLGFARADESGYAPAASRLASLASEALHALGDDGAASTMAQRAAALAGEDVAAAREADQAIARASQ